MENLFWVGRNDGKKLVVQTNTRDSRKASFRTLKEAEQFIENIMEFDRKGVEQGDYYIDAPECWPRHTTQSSH
jgi:hypothetical protein